MRDVKTCQRKLIYFIWNCHMWYSDVESRRMDMLEMSPDEV